MQLKDTQAIVVDLKSQLDQAKAELKWAQETLIISEQTISSTLCEWANELEVVKNMEQQIEELSRCSADILSKQIWYGLSELCSRFERLGLIIIKFPYM